MKLRKFIGMAAAALALSLALCGCGDKKSKSESKSDSESASSSSQTPGKFSPMVTKDAAFALGINLDKRQAFKVVDAYLDQFCSLMQLRDEETAEVKAKVAKYKKDLFADAPSQLRDFLDETGLCDTQLRWAVFSLENLKMSDYGPQLYGLSVAIAGNVNLEKLIQTVQKKSTREEVVFTEMSLEGEKAWRIEPHVVPNVFVLGMTAKMWKEIGLDLHVTSLDDQLILLASSRGALAKQIRLYRQGMAKSDALGGFSAKEGELLRLKVVDVGERIRENVSQRTLQGTVPMIADVDQVIMRLGDLEGDVTVSSDGTVSTAASLKAASEEDADKIRTLAKVGLMATRSQWGENPYVPGEFVKMLDAVKIDGTDGEIKVQNVNSLLAFYPIVSARLNAEGKTTAVEQAEAARKLEQEAFERRAKARRAAAQAAADEKRRREEEKRRELERQKTEKQQIETNKRHYKAVLERFHETTLDQLSAAPHTDLPEHVTGETSYSCVMPIGPKGMTFYEMKALPGREILVTRLDEEGMETNISYAEFSSLANQNPFLLAKGMHCYYKGMRNWTMRVPVPSANEKLDPARADFRDLYDFAAKHCRKTPALAYEVFFIDAGLETRVHTVPFGGTFGRADVKTGLLQVIGAGAARGRTGGATDLEARLDKGRLVIRRKN